MDTIHTSDWHVWNKHKYSINNSRTKQLTIILKRIVGYAIKRKIGMIVVAGDVMNVNNPDEYCLKILSSITRLCIDNKIMIRYLMGDHDTNGIDYSLESLHKILSVTDKKWVRIYPAASNIPLVYTEIIGKFNFNLYKKSN